MSNLYVVGTEDYVYRVLKGKLRSLGVTVVGHAPKHWKPPFSPPRDTTHLLVVMDDCPGLLRAHAEHLAHEIVGLDVVLAPARNKWGETEELLRRHGVLEPAEATPIVVTPELRPTIGELVAAKHVVEEAKPVPEKPVVIPEPELPPPPMITPKALAIEILRAVEGRLTDGGVAALVSAQTRTVTEAEEVRLWRLEAGAPAFQKGLKPPHLLPVFERYGLKFRDASEVVASSFGARRRKWAEAEVRDKAKQPKPTVKETMITLPPHTGGKIGPDDPRYQYAVKRMRADPSLTNWPLDIEIKAKFGKLLGANCLKRIRLENGLAASVGRNPHVAAPVTAPVRTAARTVKSKTAPVKPAPEDDFVTALRAALAYLHDTVIVPHHVSSLQIIRKDNEWSVPEAERVTVVAGAVKL